MFGKVVEKMVRAGPRKMRFSMKKCLVRNRIDFTNPKTEDNKNP